MEQYQIAGKPGHPLHPLAVHLNSLLEFQGLYRDSWRGVTLETLTALFREWKTSEPPPKGKDYVVVNFPSNPGDVSAIALARISKPRGIKSPDNKPLFALEFFKRNP